jgi:class 3 adenylate cyclase
MTTTRRLAAILAADVAGYSRLMGADEEGTLERLKGLRRDLVDPKITEHHGRIVKTTGDGLLIEFASVLDAVRSAVEVQRAMAERNADVPAGKRIEFRLGIRQGDIIIDDGDIFGDGVNLAARLEGLAEPGGICVSRVVRDEVRDKLDLAFEDLGEQQVKNIVRPIRVFRRRTCGPMARRCGGSPTNCARPAPTRGGLQAELQRAAGRLGRAESAAASFRGELHQYKAEFGGTTEALAGLKDSLGEFVAAFGVGFGVEKAVESLKALGEAAERTENIASSIGVPARRETNHAEEGVDFQAQDEREFEPCGTIPDGF